MTASGKVLSGRTAVNVCAGILLLFLLLPVSVYGGGSQDRGGPPIEFSGPGEIPEKDLLDAARRELRAFRSPSGTAADIADAAYTMELFLRDEGYARASVLFRFFRTDENGRRTFLTTLRDKEEADGIGFIVDMGRAYSPGDIRFSGNTAYDEEFLRQFFTFSRTGILNTGAEIFTQVDVTAGLSGIEEQYLLDGYYDIEVTSPDPVLTREGIAHITVFIQEGARYVIGDQEISSPDLNPDQIQALRASLPATGRPFYVRLAAEGATALRTTMGDWGFDADVTYEVSLTKTSPDEGKVSISYDVEAGKPLILSDIRVVNDSETALRTRNSLITSRFPFEPGDTLDRRRLTLGLSRLYSLGIFSTINLDIIPETDTGEPLTPADLEIHVTESENRFLEVVGGWGTWEILRGSLRYSDINLFGTGRTWTAEVSGNFNGYRAATSLQDRVLFGPASLLSLSALYLYSVEPSFTLTEGNATILFGYELGTFWTLDASYTYSLSQAAGTTAGIPDAEDELLTTGRVNLQAELDTRDSALLPQSGYRASAGIAYSSRFLGSERDFLDYTILGEAYIPLLDFAVLAFEGNFETKQILDDITTLPIQERLFLGGDNSVRSFGKDTLGPFGTEGDPLGGLTSLQLTAELRLKVWRELHFALFYDFGILSESFFSFDQPPGHGIGAGIRYYLPVGPIRLDAAWNPGNMFADTNRWELHFAVGFSF